MKKRFYVAIIILLAAIAAGNIFGSLLLKDAWQAEVLRAEEAAKATPQPTPAPTPTPTPTPIPTRPPREGDICANFPDYDTGVNADLSYQSDEVRVAIYEHVQFPDAYWVADVWIRNLDAFQKVWSNDEYMSEPLLATEIAAHNHAVFAANGDFYAGVVIQNGEIFRDKFTIGQQLLVMNRDGSLRTERMQWDSSAQALVDQGAWHTWQFGPTLIENGEIVVSSDGIRNPKTAIGYYEPGHYVFVTCDGRQKDYAVGMENIDMAEIIADLGGVQYAYNLDGGGTAQMIFANEFVNRPCADYDGFIRKLSNFICIVDPSRSE